MSQTEHQEKPSSKILSGITILMVEDDALLSELALMRLSELGCVPLAAADGPSALEMAKQNHPDIIILDMMLPRLSGEEVLRQLKADNELKNVPVIVFSNKADEQNIKYCLELGADEYLVKSMTNLSDLIDVVTRLTQKPQE